MQSEVSVRIASEKKMREKGSKGKDRVLPKVCGWEKLAESIKYFPDTRSWRQPEDGERSIFFSDERWKRRRDKKCPYFLCPPPVGGNG